MSSKQPVRSRRSQGLTLAAFGYQSVAALALVLAVSWVLPED